MKKIDKLRMEVRADFQLTWGLQADMNKRLEGMEEGLTEVRNACSELKSNVEALQQNIVTVNRSVRALQVTTGRLEAGFDRMQSDMRSLSESGRKVQGHLKHSADRFDTFLEIISNEYVPRSEIHSLEARVAKIEKRLSA